MWWQGFGEGRLGTLLSILLVWLGGEVMPPFGPVFVGGGGGNPPALPPQAVQRAQKGVELPAHTSGKPT